MTNPSTWIRVAAGLCLPALGCASLEAAEPEESRFLAHRGAFGADAGTVERGMFELEFGATFTPGADSAHVPVTVKWGAGERTEWFADLPTLTHAGAPGPDREGFGNLGLGVRHRLREADRRPALALQFRAHLPTGSEAEGFSSGEPDFFGAVMLTQAFDELAATAFYELGALGDPAGGVDLEHALALVTELSVSRQVGLFAELYGIVVPERDSEVYVAGSGLSFNLTERLAWDLGATAGLNDEAPDYELFTGFTWGLRGKPGHRR